MNDVSHKKGWFNRSVQIIVEPPTMKPIKITIDTNIDKYYVKIEFYINPTQEKSDMYEFIIYLFDNYMLLQKLQ